MSSDQVQIVIWLFGVVIAITVIAVCSTLLRERRRGKQMAALAASLGWSYEADGSGLLREGLGEVSLFALALIAHGKITNVLRRSGDGAVICDYHFWSGTGGSAQRFDHKQTVFCFELGRNRLPDFSLRPQAGAAERRLVELGTNLQKVPLAMMKPLAGAGSNLETMVGMLSAPGIEFPEHPDFAARYRLLGKDQAAVRRLFQGSLVDDLLLQPEPSYSVEKAGEWLAIWRSNVLVSPDSFIQAVNEAERVKTVLSAQQSAWA